MSKIRKFWCHFQFFEFLAIFTHSIILKVICLESGRQGAYYGYNLAECAPSLPSEMPQPQTLCAPDAARFEFWGKIFTETEISDPYLYSAKFCGNRPVS